ncbi:MAG: hypothetical protein QMC12_01990 [Flavobacteriales bacterium]|jgi:hypothetical protein|tara:strand:- start:319 stop:921 length:603 start_codon:yes stop_codon:yes gene_type:complete
MKLTQLISILLHPMFMPILALHLTLLVLPSLAFTLSQNLLLIYGILIFSTMVLPLISIFWLMQKGKVSSLEMSNHKERSLPLFKTVIWMSFGYYLLQNLLFYTPILKAELLGAILIILLAAIISKFWKISLHLLGIGGVVGVFIALQIMHGDFLYLLLLFILLSGLLGVARIKQKAHNYAQVYAGFLVGLSVELITLLVY